MEIQAAIPWYYLSDQGYLQYVWKALVVLLETFPFNVLAMLAFLSLIFRGIRAGRRDAIRMVHRVRREMEGTRG